MATPQIERKKDLAWQKRVEEKLESIEALLLSLAVEDKLKSPAKTTRGKKDG